MKKPLRDEAGFSVVEIVIVLVIVGMLGFIGWYVFKGRDTATKATPVSKSSDNTETTPPATTPKDTDAWYQYVKADDFKIRLADGLKFTSSDTTTGSFLLTRSLVTTVGVPAVVSGETLGSDNPYGLFIYYYNDAAKASQPQGDLQTGFKTDAGLEVQKYHYTQITEPQGLGLQKDDQSYTYVLVKDNHSVKFDYNVSSSQVGDAPTNVTLIEKMVKTVEIL